MTGCSSADDFTLGRPVLVGESNPYSSDPRDALSVDPPRGTGARLWRMSGLSLDEYVHGFAKVNVADDYTYLKFAASVRSSSRVVVLGRAAAARVGDGLLFKRRASWFEGRVLEDDTFNGRDCAGAVFYLVPHPGGLNRLYNDPVNASRLRGLLGRLLDQALFQRGSAR